MRLVKDYMKDDTLRHELNALTRASFGFDFESWVANGYFEGDYIPYSFEEDGKILANVSANIMTFEQNGERRNYIQIGTVMTDINYRNRGLARKLMEHVLHEYESKCDGIYLFANLGALDFYQKIGLKEKNQYVYTLKESVRVELQNQSKTQMDRVELAEAGNVRSDGFRLAAQMDTEGVCNTGVSQVKAEGVSNTGAALAKQHYMHALKHSVPSGTFDQVNKFALQMFYTADMENVYYSEKLDCFVVMDIEDGVLELHSILSEKEISLEAVIREINLDCKTLKLGFTPKKEDMHLFVAEPYNGADDYRLFCLGEKLDSIESEKLYFPTYSHA